VADRVGPVLQSALAAVAPAVGIDPGAGQVSLQPGNTAVWDNCCESGGTLWARLVSLVPKYSKDKVPCLTHVQIRAAVGWVKCVHVLEGDGDPPTAEEQTSDTLQITGDAQAAFDALVAHGWDGTHFFSRSLRLEQGAPQGPEGGCAGFEWTFSGNVLMLA
jgi:hypothetical protein